MVEGKGNYGAYAAAAYAVMSGLADRLSEITLSDLSLVVGMGCAVITAGANVWFKWDRRRWDRRRIERRGQERTEDQGAAEDEVQP